MLLHRFFSNYYESEHIFTIQGVLLLTVAGLAGMLGHHVPEIVAALEPGNDPEEK